MWVQHTDAVLRNADELLVDMAQIEASGQKFILIGDEADTKMFRANVLGAERHESVVRNLTVDNPEQQRRLSSIEALLPQQIQFEESAMDSRRHKGLEAAIDEIRVGKPQLITAQIEVLIHQIQDEEDRLLKRRLAGATRFLDQSKNVLIIGTLLGLLITATAFCDLLRFNATRRLAERALFTEKERAQVTLDSIGDAVISTDTPGNVTFLNSVAEKITGWSRQEAAGRPMDQVYRLRGAGNRAIAPNWADTAVRQDQTVTLPEDCSLLQRDGSIILIEGCIAPIHNREGRATGSVIVSRNVSASRAMALQMTHMAEHDVLTGLPNRVLLGDRITVAIASARRHRCQFASNHDPLFAPNRDPSEARGFGLSM